MTRLPALFVGFALLLPSSAGADDPPLVRFVPQLVVSAARLQPTPPPFLHEDHFVGGAKLSVVPAELSRAIALELTTFPFGYASGLGARTATASGGNGDSFNFGPFLAEHALTLGRRRLSVGFGHQSTTFNALQKIDLDAGEIRLYIEHSDCCPTGSPFVPTDLRPEFERDLLEEALSLQLDRDVYAFYANYGLSDSIDVGLAVPIVRVSISGRITARALRTATTTTPSIHGFDVLELANRTIYASDSAAGLGDIALHGKYHFVRRGNGGLAASVDLRLPTGDADNLLGVGGTRTRASLAWSTEHGRYSPHVNVGYTWSAGELSAELNTHDPDVPPQFALSPMDLEVPDELSYAVGAEVAFGHRITVGVDALGRRIQSVPRFGLGSTTFPSRGPGALPSASYVASNVLQPNGTKALNLLLGALGTRVDLGSALRLHTDLILPILDDGLSPRIMATVALGYTF